MTAPPPSLGGTVTTLGGDFKEGGGVPTASTPCPIPYSSITVPCIPNPPMLPR